MYFSGSRTIEYDMAENPRKDSINKLKRKLWQIMTIEYRSETLRDHVGEDDSYDTVRSKENGDIVTQKKMWTKYKEMEKSSSEWCRTCAEKLKYDILRQRKQIWLDNGDSFLSRDKRDWYDYLSLRIDVTIKIRRDQCQTTLDLIKHQNDQSVKTRMDHYSSSL